MPVHSKLDRIIANKPLIDCHLSVYIKNIRRQDRSFPIADEGILGDLAMTYEKHDGGSIRSQESEIDVRALEASLPTLTKKLRELQNGLSEDEQAVFSSIVSSAALHLQQMQAITDVANIAYLKPISAVASVGVRKHLVELPRTLGLA